MNSSLAWKVILENMETVISVTIPSIISVFGWMVVYGLNLKQQEKLLKNTAKMEVYKEFSGLAKEYNKTAVKLGVSVMKFSFPFIQMGIVDIGRDIDNIQKNSEGLKIWQGYIKRLSVQIGNFSEANSAVWDHVTRWDSAMPELRLMFKDLFWIRIGKLEKELRNFHQYLQDLPMKEFYWEKWDRQEIDLKSDEIHKLLLEQNAYFDDLVTEVHNALVGKIFGHCKEKRENFVGLPKVYRVLTPRGVKDIKKKKQRNPNSTLAR